MIFDSLSANAYSLYLVHYDFVVWLQYALLPAALLAVVKGAIVFGATLILSWITVLSSAAHSNVARLIGVTPHAIAATNQGLRSSAGFLARLRQLVSP